MSGFQRAFLEIEGAEPIHCWFNPKEYSITQSNTWKMDQVVGAEVPTAQFGGGQGQELTLDLLFDSSDNPGQDVRAVTARLFEMMDITQELSSSYPCKGRPPRVTFRWGSTLTFKAVARQLSVQFTLFRADGSPIRAQARLGLVQVRLPGESAGGAPPQNPTTRAVAGTGSRLVRDGDSLQSIANAAYGEPTRWREIARANEIDDPLRLRNGMTLSLPTPTNGSLAPRATVRPP